MALPLHFYTREAPDRYKRDTYKEDNQDAKPRENTASAKQTVPHASTNTNTAAPSSQET